MTGFIAHLIVYAAVNGFLVAIWAITNDPSITPENIGEPGWVSRYDFWPIWPMLGWGVGLALHGALVVLLLPRRLRRKRRRLRQAYLDQVHQPHAGADHHAPATAPAAPAAPNRGSGRRWVAVMLLDVSGSTRFNEILGDEAWSRLLLRLRQMVRATVDSHHGEEVGTQGDSLLAHFDSPADAVQCAVEVQRELEHRRVGGAIVPEVRIGVHAGEVVADDGDIVGRVVNVAARVSDSAEPGEVLVTEPVADEAGGRVTFEDRGLRSLKGLSRPRHVLAAVWREAAGGEAPGDGAARAASRSDGLT